MIRTRDLLIFIAVFVFLLICIAFTFIKENNLILEQLQWNPSGLDADGEIYTAEAETEKIDRDSIISHLRDALATLTPEVEPEPSVEESDESTSEEDMEVRELGVTYCSNYDDTQNVMRSWPASGLSVTTEGSLRSVVYADSAITPMVTGTSTPSSTLAVSPETRTLISFPAYPAVTGGACVSGEIVGVTTSGSLMYNSEVSFYRGYGAEYLIGYARDGFPIYGYYAGEVDACGGYMHPAGYRYSITPDRDYLIGCFKGTAAPFVGF